MKVAVLGASTHEERYSNMVMHRLAEKGHDAIGVNPTHPDIPGFAVVETIEDLPDDVDTLTVYVGAHRSSMLAESILKHGFRRVVFNPGAENPGLEDELRENGVKVVSACSMVMLSTGQW